MLEYVRIDVSEGIDVNKFFDAGGCIISHYWYFLMINFRFQQKGCYGYHDITQKSMIFDNTAIVAVRRKDYRINFRFMSKNEAVHAMTAMKTDSYENEKIVYFSDGK